MSPQAPLSCESLPQWTMGGATEREKVQENVERLKVELVHVLSHLSTTTSHTPTWGVELMSHMIQSHRYLTTTTSPTDHLHGTWEPDLDHVPCLCHHQDSDHHLLFHPWIPSGVLVHPLPMVLTGPLAPLALLPPLVPL